MQSLHAENYETVKKRNKRTKSVERHSMFLDWKSQYSKMYKLNTVPVIITVRYCSYGQIILKFIWKGNFEKVE
jgi:hypothetical protein